MIDASTEAKQAQDRATNRPAPWGFSHISIPTRDLAQSKQFFCEVLGGELKVDRPSFARVQFGNFGIIMAPQAGGATAPDAEYPHYAFTVEADAFMDIKHRLEAHGVPTHDPWGRQNRPHALMYFRDPSGNQFELFCPSGFNAVPLRLGHRAGGDYVIDFPGLCYDRLRPLAKGNANLPKVRPGGFNHMTLPFRDIQEGKRFFIEVVGATLAFELPDHVTVRLGGAEVGMGRQAYGATPADAEYPHYTCLVKPDHLVPLKQRLAEHRVPTSEVWSRDGVDAAMYFRDPSGNLWKLYCENGFRGAARRGTSAGGDYRPDVKALNYDVWKDPGR
jgi:catechol 2,3-dioxygenase-like lactoylglutathione lyase family enzyme